MEPNNIDTSAATSDFVPFTFGGIKIVLPKVGTKEAWNKAKKMMDIYLDNEETN